MKRRDFLIGTALASCLSRAEAFGPFGHLGGSLKKGGPAPPVVVGGDVVGQPGTGFYSGYTLSWGHDFNTLDLVSPSNPRGAFFPTGAHHPGIRNPGTAGGILSTSCDTDPYWTGYNDSNRGVAVGFNNFSLVAPSVLRLQARKSSGAEQPHLVPTDPSINGGLRPQVSAMIHSAGACAFYPTTNAVIVEMRARCSAKATNPAGSHPTFWTYTLAPVFGANGNEWDMEGTSQSYGARYNEHTNGSISLSGGFSGAIDTMDGTTFRTYTWVFKSGDATRLYVDGVQQAGLPSTTLDANSKALPSLFLITQHVYNGAFGSDIYSQAAWDASVNGAYTDVDWIKLWRTTGVSHWKPLVGVSDVNVAYNGVANVVLPSALTLWGDAGVTEYVQVVPYDGLEPGMDFVNTFVEFPTGVTYNASTRTLTADFTAGTGKAGRSHVVVFGYKPDGSTMEPLRFCINRGPVVNTPNQSLTIGTACSCDIYADCDVGVILPKIVTVTNLPAGLTFNSSTGIVSGTPTTAQSLSVAIACTNNLGQSTTKNVTFTVASANVTGKPNRPYGKQ